MTDQPIVECTYTGRNPSGRQALPTCTVPFVRGVPVAFTVDEVPFLDGDWTKPGLDLELLDKAALIALADERRVEVSPRWGEKRLRETLAAAPATETAGAAGTTDPSGDAGTTTES